MDEAAGKIQREWKAKQARKKEKAAKDQASKKKEGQPEVPELKTLKTTKSIMELDEKDHSTPLPHESMEGLDEDLVDFLNHTKEQTEIERLKAIQSKPALLQKFIENIFNKIDKNGDGHIQWIELTVFLIRLSNRLTIPIPTPHDVDDVMEEYKDSKDGKLSLELITPLVKKVLDILAEQHSTEEVLKSSHRESYMQILADPVGLSV